MKKLLTILTVVLTTGVVFAQNQTIEAQIRSLEQQEVQAVLKKDTATLRQIWDKNLIVNSPENRVVLANANPVDRPVMSKPRASFTRDIEQLLIKGDIVFSMGSETLLPTGDQPQSGQLIKRRYTNIWQKQMSGWKLIARHANVVCQSN